MTELADSISLWIRFSFNLFLSLFLVYGLMSEIQQVSSEIYHFYRSLYPVNHDRDKIFWFCIRWSLMREWESGNVSSSLSSLSLSLSSFLFQIIWKEKDKYENENQDPSLWKWRECFIRIIVRIVIIYWHFVFNREKSRWWVVCVRERQRDQRL